MERTPAAKASWCMGRNGGNAKRTGRRVQVQLDHAFVTTSSAVRWRRPLPESVPRYRFSEFILSPRRRLLAPRRARAAAHSPLFRPAGVSRSSAAREAVHRRDIFDRVWGDVVVSDSALSQAIRTIRRVLGDESREPRFVRTVSRHGYRFVFADVVEEDDEERVAGARRRRSRSGRRRLSAVDRSLRAAPAAAHQRRRSMPARKKISARLPSCCTRSARPRRLRRLGTRPNHAFARALLRDTRWDIAEAGPVPILGEPRFGRDGLGAGPAAACGARRLSSRRDGRAASIGGGLAGVVGWRGRRPDSRCRARKRRVVSPSSRCWP